LLEEEPGVSDAEVEAESQRERLPSVRTGRKHPGRQSLPGESSTGGAGGCVRSRAVRVRWMRRGNHSDRLRRE
jgi:hypothetical protein